MTLNRQIERLEHRLHSTSASQAQLNSENTTLRTKLAEVTTRNSTLESQLEKHPLQLLSARSNPLQLQNRIYQLQDRLNALNYELVFYQQSSVDKARVITDFQGRLGQLELELQEQRLVREQLEVKLEEERAARQMTAKRNEKLTARVEEVNRARMQLLTENGELQGRMARESEQHRQSLASLSKSLQVLEKFLNSQQQPQLLSKVVSDDMESIFKQQSMELEERNAEILNLKYFCEGSQPSLSEAHLKHTIKCLRSEVARYSGLARNIVEKLTLAEETVKKYSEAAERCEKQAQGINALRDENISLQRLVKYQQQKINDFQTTTEAQGKMHKQRAEILVEVLKENSYFHDLLFQTYGEYQQSFLVEEKRRYDEKHKILVASSHWTNVEELIEMNERLRRKMKESVK